MMQPPNVSEWIPCPRGEMTRLAQRIKRHRRSILVKQLTGAIAGGLLLGLLGNWLMDAGLRPRATAQRFDGGISCSQVRDLAEKFTERVWDPQTKARITAHVQNCPDCARLLKQMREEQSVRKSATSRKQPVAMHILSIVRAFCELDYTG